MKRSKEFCKKRDEKIDHLIKTFEKEGYEKAQDELNEQILYVEGLSKEFDETPYKKYLDENSIAVDKAAEINNAKKTPFMLKMVDCLGAFMTTMWMALLFGCIFSIVFNVNSNCEIIVTFWIVWLLYDGLKLYLETTLKVKFPKCSRKVKKEGLQKFAIFSNELSIAKSMSAALSDCLLKQQASNL